MKTARISFFNASDEARETFSSRLHSGLAEKLTDAKVELSKTNKDSMGIGDAINILMGPKFSFNIDALVLFLKEAMGLGRKVSLVMELENNRLVLTDCDPKDAAEIIGRFMLSGRG